jgi:hypothetical protein
MTAPDWQECGYSSAVASVHFSPRQELSENPSRNIFEATKAHEIAVVSSFKVFFFISLVTFLLAAATFLFSF